MKIERKKRLKTKLDKLKEDNFLTIPSIIYESDTEKQKLDKLNYMAKYNHYHMTQFLKFAQHSKLEDVGSDALHLVKMIRSKREEIINSHKTGEKIGYFIDVSDVKTSIMNKDLKHIVFNENIKLNITYKNGKIKVNYLFNF